MEFAKKHTKYIVIGVVALIVVSAGGYMVLGKSGTNATTSTGTAEEEQKVEMVDPKTFGLEVSFRKDKHAIKFSLSNLGDVKHIEYQIPYKHTTEDGEVSEALFGEKDIESGTTTYETDYRLFGTASSGVERFHDVTYPVTLTLKITKKDGTILQAGQTIEQP